MLERFVVKAKVKNTPIIYLTATPTRYLKYLIKHKKLEYVMIPVRFHGYPIPLPYVKLTSNTLKKINNGKIPRSIYKWLIDKKIKMRSVFIFVPTIVCGKKLEKLIQVFASCRFVHSEMIERKEIIKQFREKNFSFIITTTILERGVTVKDVDVCIIHCDDSIFDERAIVQIVGRAGRSNKHPTGDVCLFADVYTRSMKQAIQQIKMLNQKAKKENLLRRIP